MTSPLATKSSRVFVKYGKALAIPTTPTDPKTGFDFVTTLRGTTSHFAVYYETSLGANGQALADGALATCERDFQELAPYFGGKAADFSVIIAGGIGGAYHYGCSATDLYCDAEGVNVDHTRMLIVAEEVEVFSDLQGKGWDCAASNGEGLSRVLATELYPAQLNGFATAGSWLDSGRPDFVNINDPTDQNPLSTGCSVLFLNFLHSQLGFSWPAVVQAGATTLAGTYATLTGADDGFQRFASLLQRFFPPGTPSGVVGDNVFPLGAAAT